MSAATTQPFTELVHTLRNDLLIIGGWRPSTSGTTFAVMDPATGLELRQART